LPVLVRVIFLAVKKKKVVAVIDPKRDVVEARRLETPMKTPGLA
jgi:hypothetical protein